VAPPVGATGGSEFEGVGGGGAERWLDRCALGLALFAHGCGRGILGSGITVLSQLAGAAPALGCSVGHC